MKKRMLAVMFMLSAAAVSICCFDRNVRAAGSEVIANIEEMADAEVAGEADSENWEWAVLENGTVSVTQYKGEAAQVQVPSALDEKAVASIGNSAFYRNTAVTSVIIPDGVTAIGNYAFSGCSGLNDIKLPDSVVDIGAGAFSFCESLVGIVLPDHIASIGDEAFIYSGLNEIKLPAGLVQLGKQVFRECRSLKSVETAPDNTAYASENGVLFNKAKTELIQYPMRREGTSYEIPAGVQDIAEYAFYGCENPTDIGMPSGMARIGDYAFYGTAIQELSLPSGLVSIGNYAFHFSDFRKAVIPASVSQIGRRPFYQVYGRFETIEVEPGNEVYASSDGVLFNKDKTELLSYPAGKIGDTYTIPSSVAEIGEEAFGHAEYITQITIPEHVAKIKQDAFDQVNDLKQITVLNPQCVIEDMGLIFTDLTIYGHAGSTAQSYAASQGYKFQTLDAVQDKCQHQYQTTVKKATTRKNGSIQKICSICGKAENAQVIPYPKTVKLSKSSAVYNGKQQKPPVTVTDSTGKKVASGNYSVTYSNNKNVGEAAATVTFKNNYTGSIKKTFRIQPKGTSLSKVSPKAKGITVNWKKQAVQTSGYQLQYSENSKFKGNTNRIIKVNKSTKTSKVLSKLKAKKKYYVRIRTYKTVKVKGKKTEICSGWSKVKSTISK